MGKINFAINIWKKITTRVLKAGVVTRKQATDLATDVGKKLVDKSSKLGRDLQPWEIKSIFADSLPATFIPSFTTNPKVAAKYLAETQKCSPEDALKLLTQNARACVVPNIKGKNILYAPINPNNGLSNYSTIAHEVEHYIEANSLIERLKKAIIKPLLTAKQKLSRNFRKQIAEAQNKSFAIQRKLQGKYNTAIEYQKIKSGDDFASPETFAIRRMFRNSQTEGFQTFSQAPNETFFRATMRRNIREVCNPKKEQILGGRTHKFLRNVLDKEIPAYTAQANVENYIDSKLLQMMSPAQQEEYIKRVCSSIPRAQGTAEIYEEASKLLRQERRIYRKNALLGRLIPEKFNGKDKNLLKLVSCAKDKKILRKLMQNCSVEQKEKLFYLLKYNPKILSNPDIVELLKIRGANNTDFIDMAGYISEKFSLNQIKKLLAIANETLPNGELKYPNLVYSMQLPTYPQIKKFAELKIGNKNPFIRRLGDFKRLKSDELDELYAQVSLAIKNNGNIDRIIDAYFTNRLQKLMSHAMDMPRLNLNSIFSQQKKLTN